jgi:O-antigen/teichoic acid export membrane protein
MIGSFTSKFLGFVLLPFYTHYLSTDNYGYFDIINTTLILLLPLVTFEINDGLYRYLLDATTPEETSTILTAALSSTVRNLFMFSIVFIIVSLIFSIEYSYLILPALVALILSDTWQQIARGFRHNTLYSVAGVVYTFVMFTCNIVLLAVFHLKVDALLYSNIAAGFASFGLIEWKLKIFRMFKVTNGFKSMRKTLIKFSLPLMPNAMNWWVINLSSRYIIFSAIGTDANGIYAVANKFPSILILVNTIFNLAWQESAITEYSSGDKDSFYTKMFNLYMKVQLSSMLVLIPLTKLLMGFMVDPGFYSAWMYTPLIYISTIFSSFSTFYGTGYMVSKDTKGALTTSLICVIVNISLSIVLIPLFGLQAAAFANAFAFLIMWLIRYFQLKKYFKIRISFKTFFMLCFLISISIVLYYINSEPLCYAMIISGTAIFIVLNLKMFKKLLDMLSSKRKLFNLGQRM